MPAFPASQVWLMTRIAEKLEFMKVPAVKVCEKADIGRKQGIKSRVIVEIFAKLPRKRKSLTVQGDLDKIVDIDRAELCV